MPDELLERRRRFHTDAFPVQRSHFTGTGPYRPSHDQAQLTLDASGVPLTP